MQPLQCQNQKNKSNSLSTIAELFFFHTVHLFQFKISFSIFYHFLLISFIHFFKLLSFIIKIYLLRSFLSITLAFLGYILCELSVYNLFFSVEQATMVFTLTYQNVRGLRTKTNCASLNLMNIDSDFVCATETWLNDGFLTSELISDNNYVVFRRDRDYTSCGTDRGGESSLFIKKASNQ